VGLRIAVIALGLGAGCLAKPDAPGTRCDPGEAFGSGSPVPIDGTHSVEAARFNQTQTVAYLSLCPSSGDKDQCELYTAPYLPATGTFGAYARLGVSAPGYDAYPTITPDGRHMLFGSTRGGLVKVFVATADNGSFDTTNVAELDLVAGALYGNEPSMLGDGRTIYFSAGDYGVNGSELYRAEGDPPVFGGATAVPGVNGTTGEYAPVVTDDELEIFFASDRALPGSGVDGLDIFTAVRAAPAEPFASPVLVDALTTTGVDWPLWLSPDACELYYINKAGSVATLYRARR
jgi:Tol biopolymer transport system component